MPGSEGTAGKSVDAFRTISEVATGLDVPQHVLRFWETRFPQIRPLKRAGGRRYYRPADIEALRDIRRLLYDEGYTIKGVQRLFKERGGRDRTRAVEADVVPAEAAAAPARDSPDGLPTAGMAEVGARDGLRDVLAAVEDCARILAALRRPAR